MSERFDAAYYRRFYGRDGVHDLRRIRTLATGVVSMATWWRVPLRSALDLGAGRGLWREALGDVRPSMRYHGVDVSEHACRVHGHELADLGTWWPRRRADLVVCQSVLQYLSPGECAHALDAITEACAGVLYLEVPTTRDRDTAIDPSRTDLDVHWRTGAWYRRRLAPGFVEVGGGLWLARSAGIPMFELETAARS
jgi:hypothetical protein